MSYKLSQIDKKNFAWFKSDSTCNTLVNLEVSNGKIRGITPVNLSFQYPITAIVGENGSGKSTILALVTCAFHNFGSFCPHNRTRIGTKQTRNYYTYGDFFTFSPQEEGIKSIEIKARYLSGDGAKEDKRRKKPSGKWNDYNTRPSRAVTFLGINRILPPSESGPHRHYCKNFNRFQLSDQDINQLKLSMGKILAWSYDDIELLEYNSYRLFEAKRNNIVYTGFNMGAGENAVLSLLLEIVSAGRGALIVIDEIELGLHIEAQGRLIEELKSLCEKYHSQIICSTHSRDVLDRIPPEGRLYLERMGSGLQIIPEISSQYAFGKLAGRNSDELDVFVEDVIGKSFLLYSLPQEVRERINIIPIGSDQAVLKHIAVHYREEKHNFIAFLDGDKRAKKKQAIEQVKKYLECRIEDGDEVFEKYIDERLNYLPGDVWPENVLLNDAIQCADLQFLASTWDTEEGKIREYLQESLMAGKHNEFYTLTNKLFLEKEEVIRVMVRFFKRNNETVINEIIGSITRLLNESK